MDISAAQTVELTCPHCETVFQADIWLLIDVSGRRDLYRLVLDDGVHRPRCAHCLRRGPQIAAPLLLFRADAAIKLIYSSPRDMSQEERVDGIRQLHGLLRARLGDSWRDEWVQEAQASVLDIALVRVMSEAWEDLRIYAENDPLYGEITQLLNAETAFEKAAALQQAPHLLNESALDFMGYYADVMDENGQPDRAADATRHRALATRCDEIGLQAALAEAEAAWLRPEPALDQETIDLLLYITTPPERPEDVSQHILIGEALLPHLDPRRDRALWAILVSTLASRYRQNPGGDRADNIEKAIATYEALIDVLDPAVDADQWGAAVVGLSHAYQERLVGERADNFEHALDLVENALAVLEAQKADPQLMRAVKDAAATAYQDRLHGDRLDNIERALALQEEILNGADNPQERAIAAHNLGRSYLLRGRGAPADNLDSAIHAFELALTYFNEEEHAIDWALACDNLATCYLSRHGADRPADIDRAITLYESALNVRTRPTMPFEWARTMMNLGTAYAERQSGDRAANMTRAITCLRAAAEVLTWDDFPLARAEIGHNLGTALGWGSHGLATYDEAGAIAEFEAALAHFTPEKQPFQCRRSAYSLGRLHLAGERWQAALDAFEIGLWAADGLYKAAFVPASQAIEMRTNADLYDAAVTACAHLKEDPDRRRQGLVLAEAGRDRRFVNLMGLAGFPRPPEVAADLLDQEEGLLTRLRDVEQALQAPGLSRAIEQALADDRRRALADLEQTWETIAASGPAGAGYVVLRRGASPAWEDLAELADTLGKRAALVSFLTLPEEILCFLWRQGWDAPELLRRSLGEARLYEDYLASYEAAVFQRDGEEPAADHTWQALGEELLAPLEPFLEPEDLVYFIPHGNLHKIPLHALTTGGQPWIERHPVAYAPSVGVLRRTLGSGMAGRQAAESLVLGYTPSPDPVERALFLGEARGVARQLGTKAVEDAAAVSEALRAIDQPLRAVHLSCHGFFDESDPMGSGLQLADGILTAREWMALSLPADLVTLSACESGLSRAGRADELTGLMRAILYAGGGTTVLTLWTVNAASTLEWMLAFYRGLWNAAGEKIGDEAAAFRAATLALRKKYPEPTIWAPFVLVGDWR